jgi:hypothetical protein
VAILDFPSIWNLKNSNTMNQPWQWEKLGETRWKNIENLIASFASMTAAGCKKEGK